MTTSTDLFTNGARYTDLTTWREEAAALQAGGPIQRIEQPGFEAFWAVIGNEELREIEGDAARFKTGPTRCCSLARARSRAAASRP